MRVWMAAVADVVCVIVFVAIGRASHQEGVTLAGIAATAWPFLCGLAVGWVLARAWRNPYELLPTGLGVWLPTFAGGIVLRIVTGQGAEKTFMMVAGLFLGLFLLGWRLLATVYVRGSGRGVRS